MPKVFVVVLGDVGRSPRMQYHALSLANEGYNVTIIGNKGSEPIESLSKHKNVAFQYVIDCPEFKNHVSSNVAYIAKTLWQSFTLLWAIMLAGLPDFVLVQNPPAIPSLGVCYVFTRIVRAKFIIDWHNYAYTILALSLGEEHSLVGICSRFEFWFGRKSDANICVTRAMKEDLKEKHGITATTLYDRPPEHFKPIPLKEKHDLLRVLGKEYPAFIKDCGERETILTSVSGKDDVSLRYDRPGLLISSTSWTEDEDFSFLLEALQDYEDLRTAGRQLPRLLVAITGKGPLKEFYTSIMEKRNWHSIEVITPWLSAEDYPKLLACGDLGVCLHISSSELDLPMKVVDMFGCGLPVAAIHFKCLNELVIHNQNGTVFKTSDQLAEQLVQWFSGFPEAATNSWRSSAQDNLAKFRALRWHENWLSEVKPIFMK